MNEVSGLAEEVATVASAIKARCPDARIDISYQAYESEDAHLKVYPPDAWDLDQCWSLGEQMASVCSDVLLKKGFLIAVLVIEPPDHVRRANDEFLQEMARRKAS
ncbi:MAG TPA: hypothetical protein VGO93_10145 [Candidatus Xenobia bacterium]|jgi:hypothetical protein